MSDQKTLENETLIKEALKDLELNHKIEMRRLERKIKEKYENFITGGSNGWIPFVEKIETPECAKVGVCRHLSLFSNFSQTDLEELDTVEMIKNKTNMFSQTDLEALDKDMSLKDTVEMIKNNSNMSYKDKKELFMNIYGMASEDKINFQEFKDLDFENLPAELQLV